MGYTRPMAEKGGGGARPLSNADVARVLSPLLFFIGHCIYLAFWSTDPFLKKWIDGSFSFFLALVLCNIVRARVVAASESSAATDEEDRTCPGGDGAGDGGKCGEGRDRAGAGRSTG